MTIYTSKLVVLVLLSLLASRATYSQKISPDLVGTNVWHNPADWVWDLTAEGKFQTIRLGGAAYDHHLPSFEKLLEWVQAIKKVGAEPVIQISKYVSADTAAALVRFMNVEHGMNVKYWGIGNEPWLQFNRPPVSEMGAKIEEYWKPRAAAMKEADPSIKIYGPNECDYIDTMYNDLFGGKNDITGKVPGKDYYYCDGLAFHRYPQGDGNPGTEGADDIIERIVKAKAKVDEVNAKHNRTGDNALGWGIGEFNSKGGEQVHTWGNGQMFGQVLGACMKYEATFATTWSMFEHDGIRKQTDFSMIDGNHTPRASYRHMEFIAKYFKGNFADGSSSSDNVKVFGAKDGEQVSVMIINRQGDGQKFSLKLNKEPIKGENLKLNIDAGLKTMYSDEIAEQTTLVLIFKGNELTKWVYSADDFENDRAPTVTTIILK
jgi:hypothetical protein